MSVTTPAASGAPLHTSPSSLPLSRCCTPDRKSADGGCSRCDGPTPPRPRRLLRRRVTCSDGASLFFIRPSPSSSSSSSDCSAAPPTSKRALPPAASPARDRNQRVFAPTCRWVPGSRRKAFLPLPVVGDFRCLFYAQIISCSSGSTFPSTILL